MDLPGRAKSAPNALVSGRLLTTILLRSPVQVPKNKAMEATKLAIDAGFHHIDSAYVCQNEEGLGMAIRSKIVGGTMRREDIFYTSKLWPTSIDQLVQPALVMSLKKLQLDYIDLYLVHFPTPLQVNNLVLPQDEHGKLLFETVDLCDTWEALEKCKEAGLAKSIGVSNFNRRQLEMLLNKPGLKHKPVCNQVECRSYLNQSLLGFCKSKDIALVAYGALGSQSEKKWVNKNSPVLLDDPVLCATAHKHKRTPAQIALRYQLQRGVVVLAKSFSEKRLKENMQIFEFELTSEDIKTLDGLNRNIQYNPADLIPDRVQLSHLRTNMCFIGGLRLRHHPPESHVRSRNAQVAPQRLLAELKPGFMGSVGSRRRHSISGSWLAPVSGGAGVTLDGPHHTAA
ncbi:LOW QUALITY PROTEIN: aldo-keto reductase family 1 member C1-like [Ctenodactylus gundi]